jgi:hypothetical protein
MTFNDSIECGKVETAFAQERDRNNAEASKRWWVEQLEKERTDHEEKIAKLAPKFAEVWTSMERLGVVSATVSFSGEGDSGQIEDVDLSCFDFHARDDLGKTWEKDRETVAALSKEPSDHIKELVESLSDAILDDENIPDWYNNDGGHGNLQWTLATKTIEIEVFQRVVEYQTTTLTYDANGIEVN